MTKAAVERIRGVDSDYTIRSLLHRRLIVELGRSDAPGRPFLYGTGFDFLERFGLTSLEELPAARGRRGRAPGRGGRGAAAPSARGGQPHARRRHRRDRRRRLMAAERLQKVLAAAGVASRRASEALIAEGRVTVDGKVATVGDQVDPERVDHRGRRPRDRRGRRPWPTCCSTSRRASTSTTRDRHAARTVLDLLPTALVPEGARLYPVGRLDQDSEGMLLLTNDGDWAERVLHPRFGVEREYAHRAAHGRSTATRSTRCAAGIALEEGLRRASRDLRADDGVEADAPRSSSSGPRRPSCTGTGRRSPRAGSASCGGCSGPSARRSSGSSASASARSASTACAAARSGRSRPPRSAGSAGGGGSSRRRDAAAATRSRAAEPARPRGPRLPPGRAERLSCRMDGLVVALDGPGLVGQEQRRRRRGARASATASATRACCIAR